MQKRNAGKLFADVGFNVSGVSGVSGQVFQVFQVFQRDAVAE